jgi:hypothetical protein
VPRAQSTSEEGATERVREDEHSVIAIAPESPEFSDHAESAHRSSGESIDKRESGNERCKGWSPERNYLCVGPQ